MEKVAERLGHVAAVWYNVKLDSLTTSPVCLSRIMADNRVEIGSISVSGAMHTVLPGSRIHKTSK